MFYIHFDEQGNILSAANHNDAPLYTEVTKEIYEDFIFGRKQFNKNRYILLETFRINLKKFALKDSIKIKNKHKDKKVAILTHGSHIPHVHITEE
jgi:hypothetical protein